MKKLFLLFAFLLPVLVACEGDEGPMGPEGPAGENVNWHVQYITIREADWKRFVDDDGIYYKHEIAPEYLKGLNQDDRFHIYEEGTMQVFMYENFDTNAETQRPLPYILNGTNADGESQVWNFYFDYTPDKVSFYFSYSGDEGDVRPFGDLEFRIVMNWVW